MGYHLVAILECHSPSALKYLLLKRNQHRASRAIWRKVSDGNALVFETLV